MTPAERAARERKQKIFVVVGGLLLVGILAIQVPKLLHRSSSPAASSATTTTDAGAPTTVPGGTSVAASRLVSTSGLTSFSRFGAKDPFVQQVKFAEPAASPASSSSSGSGSGGGGTSPDKPGGGEGKKSLPKPATQKFTTGAQPIASMTVIAVNGARQALSAGSRFPAADPVFVLVSEDQRKKSVVVGVAGGAYTGGSRTTRLRAGKPLVLVNTTTGARYKLVLVAVGSGESASKGNAENESAATPKSSSSSP